MDINTRLPVLSIKIPNTETKSDTSFGLSDDYIIIPCNFLKHLHRSWVKVSSSENEDLPTNGGFVIKANDISVTLRVPAKRETFEIEFTDNLIFYIKEDDPNYNSISELLSEKSKIEWLTVKLKERENKLKLKMMELEKLQLYLTKK